MARQNFKNFNFDTFGAPYRYSICFFGKMKVSRMKALSFFFQNLKIESKNLVSLKSCRSLKTSDASKIMGAWELIGIFFIIFFIFYIFY